MTSRGLGKNCSQSTFMLISCTENISGGLRDARVAVCVCFKTSSRAKPFMNNVFQLRESEPVGGRASFKQSTLNVPDALISFAYL